MKNQSPIPHGTLMRIVGVEYKEVQWFGNVEETKHIAGNKQWDLQKPWIGEELKSFRIDYSLYTRTKQVKFFAVQEPDVRTGPLFSLYLDENTPREEGERIASSYMLMLNASRMP